MARSILFLLVLVAASCAPECPTRGATRCEGNTAEICDADGRWQRFIDCTELGMDWVCAPLEGDHTCVPGGDASVSDGGSR
jgi:hypothetical protein